MSISVRYGGTIEAACPRYKQILSSHKRVLTFVILTFACLIFEMLIGKPWLAIVAGSGIKRLDARGDKDTNWKAYYGNCVAIIETWGFWVRRLLMFRWMACSGWFRGELIEAAGPGTALKELR